MDMTGEYRIPAPRQKVWEALNDPDVLRQSIPGCEDLQKVSDTELTAKVAAKVGPVSAKFTGKVTLSDINPPESYKISGEGQGGVAGFAKGGADVKLEEDGDDTILRYAANAQVGGKLAQIGSRLIDSTAKKMANEFFGNFVKQIGVEEPAGGTETTAAPAGPEPTPAAEAPAAPEAPAAKPAEAPAAGGISPTVWIVGLIAVVAIGLLIFAVG